MSVVTEWVGRVTHRYPVTRQDGGAKPTLTVVVPCYNYGRYLPDLVERLLSEPETLVDVIIVDDCSPDGSASVASELAERHERVSVILHEFNRGHIQTYNDGLSQASGTYVVLLSADDMLPLGALDRAVALMEAHPTVGLVYGWAQSFEGEVPTDDGKVRNWSVWPGHTWLTRRAVTGRNVILSPEVVMRTEAMRDMVGYDATLPHSADLDLWLRTALRWDIGRVNGTVQAWYRVHGANMHLTMFAGMMRDLRERHLAFVSLYEKHTATDSTILDLRRQTEGALARESLQLGLEAAARGEDPDEIQGFGAFASEVWPEIKRSSLWERYAKTASEGMSPGRARLVDVEGRLRMHARWRRGRRYGT